MSSLRQRPGCLLPRQRAIAPAQNAAPRYLEEDGDPEALHGWITTWTWTLAGFIVYVVARWMMDACFPGDSHASTELFKQVPLLVYQLSSTAFFTALVLNLTSLMFEDNATKRQLALLSCAIKGAACHTDMLLVAGRANVVMDSFGAIVIPQRYVQWLVTTPTMVYILSKISDFTPAQTAAAIGMDVLMVLSGLVASFVPGPYLRWLMFGVSSLSFAGVLYMMGLMVYSAVKEHTSHTARRSLLFIYMCTLLIWTLFPIAWVFHVLNPTSPYGEYLNVFANFMAKVLFSSSIMYGNYMTIAQRRLLVHEAAENAHRVQLIQELRDAVTRKDQFMSLMSHELRTPLNGIIQLSDALVRGAGGEMNPKGQHFVKTIKNSSNHLLNIINDILDVAALKEGKLTIKHELCPLAKAVDHVVDIVSPLARKDVVIERHVNPRTPLIIADFSRVIQILYNLAGNALKFTHRGRVCVRVEPSAGGKAVTLEVADTGIGIPADRITGIWGAFEQVDMSVTRKYGGTGLGLNIVKQLVEAHEGSIEVHSEEGRGTTFTVTLPVIQHHCRKSLEEQVVESLVHCGHLMEREATSKRSQRLASSSGRNPSHEDTLSQRVRGGIMRLTSGLTSPKREAVDSGASASVEAEDVLYRRRTQELERENLMVELQRRTEHRRSMEDATVVSRQLELSDPERQAELNSRSLERLELQIAARGPSSSTNSGASGGGSASGGGGAFGGSRHRSDAGTLKHLASGCGAAGSFNAWRGETEVSARRFEGRRSLTAADAREAIASTWSASGDSCLYPADEDHRTVRSPGFTEWRNTDSGLDRKLSRTSINGKSSTVRDSLRIRTYGRGPAATTSGSLNSAHSGALPSSSSNLLKALDSDLYRGSRKSFEEVNSGPRRDSIDSDSDRNRGSRRSQRTPRPSKLLPNSAPLNSATGAAGNTAVVAPPLGLTMDKLAYSDMFGTVQILSVDDEEVNQIVLEEILTSSGYHYARCMDGVEALEWLCASETMPDLILLDCMMPHMSGHEFCATLRKVIPGNVLPVIMVSAKSDEDNIVEGLRSGSNDFIRKPYQREELMARIETQLRLKSDSWWLAELVNNVDGRETESMKLLKNILPESIIARMQQGQKFVADSHDHVVILFSDIVGFTSLSSKLPTAEVFLMLCNMFTSFDKLTDRFSVYKVETIGDAYMVAAGHDEDEDKARKGAPIMRVLGFAKAMLDVVRNIRAPNGERMRIRIGVHCGPAFAGVIGMKCPRYCFLGDTVNTASRMESTGFPMCIHVSENVFKHHPNPEVELVEVGEREVKGKGRMRTYLVKVGSWEQALIDMAARLKAAASAAQLQRQLLAAQATLLKQQQQQQQQQLHIGQAGSEHCAGGEGGGSSQCSSNHASGQEGKVLRAVTSGSGEGAGSRSAGIFTLPLSRTPSDDVTTGRLGHLLATVREDLSDGSSSAPPLWIPSPSEQHITTAMAAEAAAFNGGGSHGGFMRASINSATGFRSPLSRPDLSHLPARSTFGSEAFYCEESSEDGGASTLNGLVLANGTLRSCSGSLTGLLSPSGLATSVMASTTAPATVTTVYREAASDVLDHGGGSVAAARGDATQWKQSDELLKPGEADAMGSRVLAMSVDHKYLAQQFSDCGELSMGSTGLERRSMPNTVEYMEQRIASLGTQLAVETSKRQRVQAELDSDRRHLANALQQVAVLQQQAVTLAAAAMTASSAHGNHVPASVPASTVASTARGSTSGFGESKTLRSHHLTLPTAATPEFDEAQTSEPGEQVEAPQLYQEEEEQRQKWQQQPRRTWQERSSYRDLDTEVVILSPANEGSDDGFGGNSATGPVTAVRPVLESRAAHLPRAAPLQSRSPMNLPYGTAPCLSPADRHWPVDALSNGGSSRVSIPNSPFTSMATEWCEKLLSFDGNAAGAKDGHPQAAETAEAGGRGCGALQPPSGEADAHTSVTCRVTSMNGFMNPAAVAGTGSQAVPAPSLPYHRSLINSAPVLLHRSIPTVKRVSTTATAYADLQFSSGLGGKGGAGVPHSLRSMRSKHTLLLTSSASLPDGSSGGTATTEAVPLMQPSWILPRCSLDLLFEELGLLAYLDRFQEESIQLDQLLCMEVGQLERLGLRPLGYCLRLRDAVLDLARRLLRACEEATMMVQPRTVVAAMAASGDGIS